MFKFLKEKLKSAVSKISKKVEAEAKEEVKEEEIVVKPKKVPKKIKEIKPEEKKPKKFFEKVKEKFVKPKPEVVVVEKPAEIIVKEKPPIAEKLEKPEEIVKEKPIAEKLEFVEEAPKGLFKKIKQKIITKKITETQFEELFWDLELAMLENNIAVEVIEKIKTDLKQKLVNVPIKKSKIEETIKKSLKESIESLFEVQKINLIEEIKKKKEKPYVIVFVGVNGSGKTTSIAKVAHLLLKNNLSCVLVAADTWRAASIEQLEYHANKLGVKIVKHKYGSDPAAVCFDGRKMGEARHIDAVLIDTAGRQHSNKNLLQEMRKIVKVAKPDLKIFVGESIVGNDAVLQGQQFNEAVNIDGIILAKADVDEKGGAAVSISYVTKKPILYLGTGQLYSDLKKFNKEEIIKNLDLGD